MRKKKAVGMERVIGAVVVLVFLGVIAYFFLASSGKPGEMPSFISDDMRDIYGWAKTPVGWNLLEKLPCYCGCKFEGHLHARHCFWTDERQFDKHGLTCSVCLDIAKKARAMHDAGKSDCEIRKAIDAFYAPNKNLATPTPMPEGCE